MKHSILGRILKATPSYAWIAVAYSKDISLARDDGDWEINACNLQVSEEASETSHKSYG
jgi:hypothetical protein